jgi:beta-galactosidase
MKKILFFVVALLFISHSQAYSEGLPRQTINFNTDWLFYLGDDKSASAINFNDASWRKLNLPHDWSIEGAFSEKHPATAGGGALPGGTGWYRKKFTIPESSKGKVIFIDFDGIYRNSEVWINGHYLGKRPSGYISFRYELSPYLYFGTQQNVIAVRVDNADQPNSRWYSGSGIYRNVWLTTVQPVFIEHWGTYITTPEIQPEQAKFQITTTIRNRQSGKNLLQLKTILLDAAGKQVAQNISLLASDSLLTQVQNITVPKPVLWSVENPYLYKVVSEVIVNNKVTDRYETLTGIRSFYFDRAKGFFLNGKRLKIKGICNHHDLGCLGAAINKRALERQLELLKAMGCNAIRTSHNPPAPELLDLADKMGFLIMDEAFDMWKEKKSPFDYSLYWDEWHKKDLESLILRDRNHPSIILWSIGNEIWEQSKEYSVPIANELIEIIKNLDKTRSITQAIPEFSPSYPIIQKANLDIIGFNYGIWKLDSILYKYPNKPFILTETTSALETRGVYDMPSDSIRIWPIRWDVPFKEGNPDLTCSAYDNVHVPWGATHEEMLKKFKKYDFLSGMFVWTGFDYLGEPTPYWYPARSSYFGIIDLAGFPKDVYYLYQSEWATKPVLHLFPHWNWKEGELVDVWAYSNAEEVELFLNDKSLGIKKKTNDQLHVFWRVPFAPGKLTAVSRTNGKVVLTREIQTAGKPAKITLTPDRTTIKANGQDLSFVTVKITDSNGNVIPDAENLIKFELKGEAVLEGVDNGNPTSLESFKISERKAFHGLCLAIIKTTTKSGIITLKATGQGLTPAIINLQSQ